jgi:peptidyl-prolyl cis-trans isomerase C
MKIKLLAAAVFAGALAAPLAYAQDDAVVARVNGVEIKKSDVTRELGGLPPQLQQVPLEQIYPQLLERMIDSRLLLEQAKAAKINETEDFKQRMARAEERIMADVILREKVKPLITEAKVKAKYDAVIGKAKPEDEVRARHILVKTEKEAKDIIAELAKGGDFAKIATEKSDDKGSAEQGGDLGFFTKGTMVPAFAKAAFDMKPGETSKAPVKTDFGYHIIKVEERRKAAPIPMDKVRPQIEAGLGEEVANEYVDGLRKKAKIERFDLEGKPMEAPKK